MSAARRAPHSNHFLHATEKNTRGSLHWVPGLPATREVPTMNTRSPSSLNHRGDGPVSPETELRIERVGRALHYRLILNGRLMASRPLAGAGRLLGDALIHLMLADLHRRPSDCRCNAGPDSTGRECLAFGHDPVDQDPVWDDAGRDDAGRDDGCDAPNDDGHELGHC